MIFSLIVQSWVCSIKIASTHPSPVATVAVIVAGIVDDRAAGACGDVRAVFIGRVVRHGAADDIDALGTVLAADNS